MKLTLWGVVAFISFFAVGLVFADDESGSGKVQTVTGEVVDMACYLSEGASGPAHRECAQKCIASGLPVGIKSGDIVYLAIGSEHGPVNAPLAQLAAKQVEVEGVVSERNGMHLIAIKKLTIKD